MNLQTIAEVMADMKKFYDDLIIINLYQLCSENSYYKSPILLHSFNKFDVQCSLCSKQVITLACHQLVVSALRVSTHSVIRCREARHK